MAFLIFTEDLVKKVAFVLAPFNNLLKGHPKKRDCLLNWTKGLYEAFEQAKSAFVNYALLQFPGYDYKLVLTYDASGIAVGSVLEQITNNSERQPLAFFFQLN